jgi:hypothetical protein
MNVVTNRDLDRWRPTNQFTMLRAHDDWRKPGRARHRLAPTVDLIGVKIRTAGDVGNRRTRRERG